MSEVMKGFRQGRFSPLSDRDKRDIVKVMARVAEQAYRRGVQQGAGLLGRPSFRSDLWEWRYTPSLDLSPCVDSPRATTSLDRLQTECGGELRELGLLFNSDANHRHGRILWTGYTREQRRKIRECSSEPVAWRRPAERCAQPRGGFFARSARNS